MRLGQQRRLILTWHPWENNSERRSRQS